MTLIRPVRGLKKGANAMKAQVHAFDLRMKQRYSPAPLTALALLVIALIGLLMLFATPCLGVSNDGSYDNTMADCGLKRLDSDTSGYFSYYQRTYLIEDSLYKPNVTPWPMRMMIGAAITLDTLLTGDALFDMRALALIYLIMYLGVLYPVLSYLLSRVQYYSEGMVICVLCVLVLGDVSFMTRFASLYTQPLELILMLGIFGALFDFQSGMNPFRILPRLMLMLIVLMSLNTYCALAGIVFSSVFFGFMAIKHRPLLRACCLICALVLCFYSAAMLNVLEKEKTPDQQYNAMTRGVLFEADDPAKALESFGIEPRFSVLTDTYADQSYPFVKADSGLLNEGFFDRYNTLSLCLYYLEHPGSFAGIFDVAVKASFQRRPDYSGNYEQSANLPPMAKSPFMALWSTFKSQSAPKTAAVFVILAVALFMLYRKDLRFAGMIAALAIFAAIELMTVVVFSGDSELIREGFLMGCHIDMFILLLLSESLHKLDIIRGEDEI